MACTCSRRCLTLITLGSAATTHSPSAPISTRSLPFITRCGPIGCRSRSNVRANMAVWDHLFFKPGEFRPDPGKTPEWNRGAFLTEGLGHCGLCHTPKNTLGGDQTSRPMQGYALQGWFAPDLTNDPRRGLGSWSVDEIATDLKTGHNKTTAATGLMAETISRSTIENERCRSSRYRCLFEDQPGDPANTGQNQQTASPAPDSSVIKIGQQIYADECSACHKADGKGTTGLFPTLAGASVVQQTDPTSLLHVVLRGALSVATPKAPTAAGMPAFSWVLNDDQIAAVVTYIRNNWGNSAPAVTASDVAKRAARSPSEAIDRTPLGDRADQILSDALPIDRHDAGARRQFSDDRRNRTVAGWPLLADIQRVLL